MTVSECSSRPERRPPANYGRLAGCYSFLEYLVFGNQLQKCRLAWWKELLGCERILLLGDGNGRFSTHLLSNLPNVFITSLDASSEMLEAARKRRKSRGIPEHRIQSIHEDILRWEATDTKSFDAVVAQFFFDSFEEKELRLIFANLKKAIKTKGRLLVSEFNLPKDTRVGELRAKLTLGCLYPAFGCITGLKTRRLVAHTPILKSYGFRLQKTAFFCQKTLLSQIFYPPD